MGIIPWVTEITSQYSHTLTSIFNGEAYARKRKQYEMGLLDITSWVAIRGRSEKGPMDMPRIEFRIHLEQLNNWLYVEFLAPGNCKIMDFLVKFLIIQL